MVALDLRDVVGLEAFVRYLKQRYAATGVDILINNACQTIRRPAGYYRPLMEGEQRLWRQADDVHRRVLAGCREFEQLRRRIVLDQQQPQQQSTLMMGAAPASNGNLALPEPSPTPQSTKDGKPAAAAAAVASTTTSTATHVVAATAPSSAVASSDSTAAAAAAAPFETTGLSHSAAMSQTILLPEDVGVNDDILPPGVSDINGQQLDLRTTNSWLLKMEEVSTPELMECMLVNAMAPFVLNARLKPLMTVPQDTDGGGDAAAHRRPDRYIINVSAMEGKVSSSNAFL